MSKEQGKQRVQRIQLDYHRARGLIYWSRWIAASVAVVIGVGYTIFAASKPGANHVSTGSISLSHAHFESDCNQCHSENLGVTLSRDSFSLDPYASIQHRHDSCMRCHPVAGHFTNHLQDPNLDKDCSQCHVEHEGRNFDLLAISDQKCLACHSNLEAACKANHKPSLKNVSDFSIESHSIQGQKESTFRSLLSDPGRVKFDHAQHMMPGQVNEGQRGAFTYEMLSDVNRMRYGDGTGSIELDCSDCHELSVIKGPENSGDSGAGDYYAPISYDRHCSACHGLNYVGQTGRQLPLPHAAPWDEVESLLLAKLATGSLTGEIRSRSEPHSKFVPPGKSSRPVPDEASRMEERLAELAIEMVSQGCQKCHSTEDITDEAILRLTGSDESLVPQKWLKHGRFSHSAHTNYPKALATESGVSGDNCSFCHAIPSNPQTPPTDHETVMIGGPETCVPCHQPIGNKIHGTDSSGAFDFELFGASDDCKMCHRYHWTRPQTTSLEIGAR